MIRARVSLIAAFCLALSVAACTPAPSGDPVEFGRAMADMNRRDFAAAERRLEALHRRHPGSRETALLLAQAHLGQAGFELLRLAEDVMAAQRRSNGADLVLRPRCPGGELESLEGQDFRCVLFRIVSHLPEADDPHLLRALGLLRAYYPDSDTTPTEVNFLTSVTELSSAMTRLKAFLSRETARRFSLMPEGRRFYAQFTFTVHHLKRIFSETMNGFDRARHSYSKVSRLVVNFDGMPLIRVGERELVFNENLGVPALLRFFGSVLGDEAERVDAELNQRAAESVSGLGVGLLRFLRSLDLVAFDGDHSRTLVVAWRFERVIGDLLNRVAGDIQSDRPVKLFELVWKDPPVIFERLAESVSAAWEREDARPLMRYWRESGAEWREFQRLGGGWESWMQFTLRGDQKRVLLSYIRYRHREDGMFGNPPPDLNPERMRTWFQRFLEDLGTVMADFLAGRVSEGSALTAAQAREGKELLERTENWIERNLWEVPDL